MAESKNEQRGQAKTREGVVVSSKMDKTVVVAVGRQVRNAMYGKYIRQSKHYMAHAENGMCKEGDLVRITETRPLSRHKRWKVSKVLTKAE